MSASERSFFFPAATQSIAYSRRGCGANILSEGPAIYTQVHANTSTQSTPRLHLWQVILTINKLNVPRRKGHFPMKMALSLYLGTDAYACVSLQYES